MSHLCLFIFYFRRRRTEMKPSWLFLNSSEFSPVYMPDAVFYISITSIYFKPHNHFVHVRLDYKFRNFTSLTWFEEDSIVWRPQDDVSSSIHHQDGHLKCCHTILVTPAWEAHLDHWVHKSPYWLPNLKHRCATGYMGYNSHLIDVILRI